jgi:hypothetical protein
MQGDTKQKPIGSRGIRNRSTELGEKGAGSKARTYGVGAKGAGHKELKNWKTEHRMQGDTKQKHGKQGSKEQEH